MTSPERPDPVPVPERAPAPAAGSPLRQGLARRGFGLTLLIVEFGVLSSFLFSLALYIFGTVQTVHELWAALPGLGQSSTLKTLLVSAIEQADVLLVATALLIISIGLQALFVQQLDDLPDWLHIRTFDDLKNKLLGIVVVALVVEFFKLAIKWDGSSSILTLGLALAAIILAVAAYTLAQARANGSHGQHGHGEQGD